MASKRRNEVGMSGNGGQFAPVGRSEADVRIATDQEIIDALPHSPGFERPILDDHDAAEIQDFGLEGFDADFSAWHDEASGQAVAEVGLDVPDTDLMGLSDLDDADMTTEESEQIHRGTVVLDQILRERYPDADISYDAERPHLSWAYRRDGMSTEEQMHDRAWNDEKGPVTFANEADAGTFGHEHLGRIFRERMENTAMVNAPTLYGSAALIDGQRTAVDLDNDIAASAQFRDEAEVEMPTDLNVLRYAGHLAESSDQMKRLSEYGHCSAGAALDELDKITPASARHGSDGERFESYQLCRWIERSNEELHEEWIR